MMAEQKYRFELETEDDIELLIPDGVFTPTGTTRAIINAVQSYLEQPRKTLDLGCGSGIVGLTLHRLGLVSPPLYASDLSPEAVRCIESNARSHGCNVVARCGRLFEPWRDEQFECVVDDVSGIAEQVARVSPWFHQVPCDAGVDGTALVREVLQQAQQHLLPGGPLFFPAISFSNVPRIVDVAKQHFQQVKQLVHDEWPLPKEMYEHLPLLERLKQDGHVQFTEKFGMIICFTDVYVAHD